MKRLLVMSMLLLGLSACAAQPPSTVSRARREKTSGVYTSIISFAGQEAMTAAVNAKTSFLKDKHKKAMATSSSAANIDLARRCGFDTLFMTVYLLWGTDWWAIPEA